MSGHEMTKDVLQVLVIYFLGLLQGFVVGIYLKWTIKDTWNMMRDLWRRAGGGDR